MSIELLAPAGSYDSLISAISAGADAIYIGGSRFGARAYADNLDQEQMLRAIDYTHLHGRKLYMTVNTLLKDDEVDQLYEYLMPYYAEGLDAVIVQDYGVMQYIKEQFPGMDIHASTQMTVTGAESSRLLKKYGASRIVTAREMSLKEIRLIHDTVDIEIESFVHGALCFCYSGQCLFSSVIGGRSGNRGRCAQPCRLPYELLQNNKKVSAPTDRYLMSPKDMCTINMIPQLAEAGIYSFKMEGRMKKPEYTAGITSIYRKYIDRYLSDGPEHFNVSDEDYRILMDLYNRGGFSEGYYKQHNSKEMMSLVRPNHMGTEAIKVIQTGNLLSGLALEQLHEKDVIELPGTNGEAIDFVYKKKNQKGDRVNIQIPKNCRIKKSQILYRTRNQYLIDQITEEYIKKNLKVKIKGILILLAGESAKLVLEYQDEWVTVEGETVQKAIKRPLSKADAEKQILKTGQTPFQFEELDVQMDQDIFVANQELNDLRRKGLGLLEKKICAKSYRKVPVFSDEIRREFVSDASTDVSLTASVETKDQFYAILKIPEIKRIYVSYALFSDYNAIRSESDYYIDKAKSVNKECYFVTPWIERSEKKRELISVIDALKKYDGLLVKSIEAYAMLESHGYDKALIADFNLYSWNRYSRVFLKESGFAADTAPVELNYHELRKRGLHNSEMVIYGYLPLMISAQCFKKNTIGCDHKPVIFNMKDRKDILFPIKNLCGYCSNIIYNSAPLELIDYIPELKKLSPQSMRLSFTIEGREETEQTAYIYANVFAANKKSEPVHKNFTRGHFKRGVE